ncbi:MAG: hypothetical protein ACR2NN_17580 [Bryobacteraceae bacterium]
MKKIAAISILVLCAVLVLTERTRSAPFQATGAQPQARSGNILTFRITFGDKQERTSDYSGNITMSDGKVVRILPWRFGPEDRLEGTSSWSLKLRRINFENQPDVPTPIGQSLAQNIVPAGVDVTVDAPASATAQVRTASANFSIALRDMRLGRKLSFDDGDVVVQSTLTPQQISPAQTATEREEHDYPSLALAKDGSVWVAWQAYRDNGDNVYVRHSMSGGWSAPFRLTTQKGDVFQTAIAEDGRGRIWVVWSQRANEDWNLWARVYSGNAWSPPRQITSGNSPNMFHKLIADSTGNVHLIWTGYQDGTSHLYWSKLSGDQWSGATEISGPSAWSPEGACDSHGNLYIVWDSYRNGNYDIFLRRIAADGTQGQVSQVTRSVRFQAHPTVATDKQDRVWVAWDESGANWGKDWNRDDMWRGTTLYFDRHPRVAVFDNSQWKQPAAGLSASMPSRYNRYVELPRVLSDSSGRIWIELEIRTVANINRSDHWANGGRWERFLTTLEGGRWTPLTPIPETSSRPESPIQIRSGAAGNWLTWVNDNRTTLMGGPPGVNRAGPNNMIFGAEIPSLEGAPQALLSDFTDGPGNAVPIHRNETADVQRIRSYRVNLGGTELRILRGDFHRHTEISQDGAGDGSVEDYWRYMLDAASMDTGIISDHNAGQDNEYTWWRTEKAIDLFHIRGRMTPLFGYERSVNFPNGHRNVVFAERGVRTLPVRPEENQGKVNTGPILYPYLRQNRGICMLHSLATDQGSDYRDNDPVLEPLVELYQGYHTSGEYVGAPRAEDANYTVPVHGKYQPSGMYWNALAKGYKLGVQSSSDHVSTHSSYTLIYTPTTRRADIVESMRKRHAYGATDNIVLDFEARDAAGRQYLMGDAFSASAAPQFSIKAMGTGDIEKLEIVKDGKFVFETPGTSNRAEFTYVDSSPGRKESYYYVRVMQKDRNLAWSSPIWVNYGK